MLPGQLSAWWGRTVAATNITDACAGCWASPASERAASPWDVISTAPTRKPGQPLQRGRAFSNDHRAGGQWGQYGEMAVRRVLTTAPAATFNNQPVRRRDAGRVFWARPGPLRLRHHRPGHDQPHHRIAPEELRLFLEEAAGVSKYKERRRETENRLAIRART